MEKTINAKELRASLPGIVRRIQQGERFTVLYRSRPAFRLVPVEPEAAATTTPLSEDPLFRAAALGSSTDGLTSTDHDAVLYGSSPR